VAGAPLEDVTAFYIPHATLPAGETDGPLGALFLARTLPQLGVNVSIITDAFAVPALRAGLAAAKVGPEVSLVTLPEVPAGLTHLVALERVGQSHTPRSSGVPDRFRSEVPAESWGRCHTMSGRDITAFMQPVESIFIDSSIPTIGIGDGGNEIGMGKVPWRVIASNIPNGAKVACRVKCDHLVVAGVSNWGAYALAAGVAKLRGQHLDESAFDPDLEQELLRVMVEAGPLVDGLTGRPTVTVDGLAFGTYIEPLMAIGQLVGMLGDERR